jgi:hypothetical protein
MLPAAIVSAAARLNPWPPARDGVNATRDMKLMVSPVAMAE